MCTYANKFESTKCDVCGNEKPLNNDDWSCPQCTFVNEANALKCDICNGSIPSDKNEWDCLFCTYKNKPTNSQCEMCNKPKPVRIFIHNFLYFVYFAQIYLYVY